MAGSSARELLDAAAQPLTVRVQPKTVQTRSIEPWVDDPMAKFDQETLRKPHDCKEVAIRTTKHPGSAVTIWAVVSSPDVFIRSVRGTKGRWYRDLANGGPATLEFDGEQLAVQAVPAIDASSIERASQEFLSKYRSSPYAASIVRLKMYWRLRYGWTHNSTCPMSGPQYGLPMPLTVPHAGDRPHGNDEYAR